ncbi:MAG: sugar ABC transporter permease, partial [Anaerocolumna jejuensis]
MLQTIKKYKAPYLFILPFFLLFLVFQLIPTIWTFYISLTNWKGIGSPEFCGVDNYKKMLVDNMFWAALRNTALYWVVSLILILVLA